MSRQGYDGQGDRQSREADRGAVTEFLESIGKTPNKSERRKNNRLTDEQIKKIGDLISQGKGTTEIGRTMGISVKTADYYRRKIAKEKEPATAATVTDSVEIKTDDSEISNTVSISKDNIIEPKSQELLKRISKEFLEIYNRLDESHQHAWDLGELYAGIKEVVGE